MKLSAKAEYACVALVELAARRNSNTPVSLKAVAEQYGISPGFLTQIFLQLKGAGLVVSVRGAAGGYQLARDPDDIRLAEVIEIIDGPPPASSALASMDRQPIVASLIKVWQRAGAAERAVLNAVSLGDLTREAHDTGIVYFQI